MRVTREAFDQARGKACSGPFVAESEALDRHRRDQAAYEWWTISQAAELEAESLWRLAEDQWGA